MCARLDHCRSRSRQRLDALLVADSVDQVGQVGQVSRSDQLSGVSAYSGALATHSPRKHPSVLDVFVGPVLLVE